MMMTMMTKIDDDSDNMMKLIYVTLSFKAEVFSIHTLRFYLDLYRQTYRWMDRQMNGRTDPLTEMRKTLSKKITQ